MRNEYGCDDMDWLLDNSGVPHAIRVKTSDGAEAVLPVARFDNREDKTSFLRDDC